MTSLVERLARAIHEAEFEGAAPAPGGADHAFYLQIARAVIAEIERAEYVVVPREPSGAMQVAAVDWMHGIKGFMPNEALGVWSAMLSAAPPVGETKP